MKSILKIVGIIFSLSMAVFVLFAVVRDKEVSENVHKYFSEKYNGEYYFYNKTNSFLKKEEVEVLGIEGSIVAIAKNKEKLLTDGIRNKSALNQMIEDENDENENINDRILRLWPSPASSYFILSFNEAGNRENISVEVSNTIGEQVFRKNIDQADVMNMVVDCKSWSPGFYIVKLTKGNSTYTEKVMVGE